MTGDVAMSTLVERIEPQEIGASTIRSGGALSGPREGRLVIPRDPHCTFVNVPGPGQDVLVGNSAHKFQIGDADGAVRMRGGDQGLLHLRWERGAPQDRSGIRIEEVKPHAPHATPTCVTRAGVGGRSGH